ncbi:MAG: lasso peptide biosynthesis B2 protein [Acidimicrobiia bacterium]
MSAWDYWKSLRPPERLLVVYAAWLLTVISIRLRLFGFGGLRARLSSVSSRSGQPLEDSPVRLTELVSKVAKRLPWKANCLERSLTLAWLLRRRGHAPSLRIGVRRATGELLFHAWIELDGLVLNDAPDVADNFTPFSGETPPPTAAFL